MPRLGSKAGLCQENPPQDSSKINKHSEGRQLRAELSAWVVTAPKPALYLLLLLEIDVNLVQKEEDDGEDKGYTSYLLEVIGGLENRCLTSAFGQF